MGDSELTSLPLWQHGTPRYLESEREQRNSSWSRSAHTPIKWISEHRDTISCHPLCCTNDLIDMKGRCCPKIVVSIPRSLFTSGQLRHIGGIVPKTALPWWRKVCKKREVDIISRYKWWLNEELHRWSFDKPLKIVYHWYLKYSELRHFSWWLGNVVSIPRGRRFHSRKYVVRKISIGIYFHILTQYKPIIGRISVMVSK